MNKPHNLHKVHPLGSQSARIGNPSYIDFHVSVDNFVNVTKRNPKYEGETVVILQMRFSDRKEAIREAEKAFRKAIRLFSK